jgi:ABC-type Zn2+ transport system substrate-binding protein/surface adhesin
LGKRIRDPTSDDDIHHHNNYDYNGSANNHYNEHDHNHDDHYDDNDHKHGCANHKFFFICAWLT